MLLERPANEIGTRRPHLGVADRLIVAADVLAGVVYVASYCTEYDGALILGSIHLVMAGVHAFHLRQRSGERSRGIGPVTSP